MNNQKFPLQPIFTDDNGTQRFVSNRIVEYFLDYARDVGGPDLNKIAGMDFTNEERTQFAQLIGYSLSGFSELRYVSDESYGAACYKGQGAISELEARNKVLTDKLNTVREALKDLVPAVYRIHPDDLEFMENS